MSADRVFFIDTNIFIYAYDKHSADKHRQANRLIGDLIDSGTGVISEQVVREFYNATLHKLRILKATDTTAILQNVLSPLVVRTHDLTFYQRAAELYLKYSLSFYDALIVQAALDIDCRILYSEDLQHGQKFGHLEVVDPFKR